jgi:hypothetical protein
MRTISLLLLPVLALTSAAATGAERQILYYVGEAKISSASGQPMPSQVILLEKIVDPNKSVITERAIIVKADGSVEEYRVTMTIKDSDFTLVDDAKSVSGSGKFFGPAWAWTYFKASFKATNGVTIEDENFMADPSAVVARKKIIAPDGKVMMYMDITLKTVTPEMFNVLSKALLKNVGSGQ